MSDGNFNRALLPHTPYQSGLKAGKSMCRMHAINVLNGLLPEMMPGITPEECQQWTDRFRTLLSQKL